MDTTKQNQEQRNVTEYNAYDEYLYEMNKKYECERARVFKQIEQEKQKKFNNITRESNYDINIAV